MHESPNDPRPNGQVLTFDQGLEIYFRQRPIGFGRGDIFCFGALAADDRIKAYVSAVLGYRNREGESPVQQVVVVLPPKEQDKAAYIQRIEALLNPLLAAAPPVPVSNLASVPRLKVVITSNLYSESVISVINEASASSVIVLHDAHRYRSEDIQPYEDQDESPLFLPEDIWVPQIHWLTTQAIGAIHNRHVYIMIDVGQWSPTRPAMSDVLASIEKVEVLRGDVPDESERSALASPEKWLALLADGRIGVVLAKIDAIASISQLEKKFLRVQAFHHARLFGQALEELELLLQAAPDRIPDASIHLARIAADAGASALASRLINEALSSLASAEVLGITLSIATDIGDAPLAEAISRRFEALYPRAAALKRRKVTLLLKAGKYRSAADIVADDPSFVQTAEMCAYLVSELTDVKAPDYFAIRKRLVELMVPWVKQALASLVGDALRRGLLDDAYTLLLSTDKNEPSWHKTDLQLTLIERLLIKRGKEALDSDRDHLLALTRQIVGYLADNPGDASVRVRLTRVLSASASGSDGMPIIAQTAISLIGRPFELQMSPPQKGISVADLHRRIDELTPAFEWLSAEGGVVVGQSVIPKQVLPDSPEDFAPAIEAALLELGRRAQDDSDVNGLLIWLSIGTSCAAYSSEPLLDLQMIRQVAGRLVALGRVQAARDLTDQPLRVTNATPDRKRAAWFVIADVYQRLRNPLESLIALSCAISGELRVNANQAWNEADLLGRLFRDIGLFNEARIALDAARRILEFMNAYAANESRHLYRALSIDVAELLANPKRLRSEIPSLLARLVENGRRVLAEHDDSGPVAILLTQMIRIAKELGISVTADADSVLADLLKPLGSGLRPLQEAMSASQPSEEMVLRLYKATETARYAEDVAFDGHACVMAARRLLRTSRITPETAIFAIELIADLAIATPGWELTAKPAPAISSALEPSNFAKIVSTQGLSVVSMGFDADGLLVRVTAVNGGLEVIRENRANFSVAALHEWSRTFPYAYGNDGTTGNHFFISTNTLHLTGLPDGPVLVILDTDLQQFPPNLLRIGDNFAGLSRPMASSPSFSWLAAARARQTQTSKNRAAWISTADKEGQTLVMVANRLGDTLSKYDITLDTGATLPTGLAGFELVVITAHGSIGTDGLFFQRISDEGNLHVLSTDLAESLRNVGVVVLFVCSGGRANKHPFADTTVGLAKQLLDRGCSAVVASPWPLDPRVTYHWLPEFMKAWDQGETLVNANYQANLAVARGMGGDLSKCIAMTVFGDPLVTAHRKAHIGGAA